MLFKVDHHGPYMFGTPTYIFCGTIKEFEDHIVSRIHKTREITVFDPHKWCNHKTKEVHYLRSKETLKRALYGRGDKDVEIFTTDRTVDLSRAVFNTACARFTILYPKAAILEVVPAVRIKVIDKDFCLYYDL